MAAEVISVFGDRFTTLTQLHAEWTNWSAYHNYNGNRFGKYLLDKYGDEQYAWQELYNEPDHYLAYIMVQEHILIMQRYRSQQEVQVPGP